MKKRLGVVITVLVVIVGGALYRALTVSDEDRPQPGGIVREFTMRAVKNEWRFEPELLEVDVGDRLVITVVNEDDYDHGFSIDAFGISERVPAQSVITVDFTAAQAGEFPYYCSIQCGGGMVHGVPRGHFDQVGKIRVRSTGEASR